MKKVFIDCGANVGQGLKQFISMYNIDSSWIIETFEPNLNLINTLKSNISNFPVKAMVHNKAIWDKDGEVEFSIMQEESEGSSVEKLMDSGVCANPNSISYRKHDTIVKVPCIDMSTILKAYHEHDYILVKMDIEGSEFRVLRKIIADDTISLIDDLYIEWHTQYMSSENIDTQNKLIQQISSKGIRIHNWY